MSNVGAGSGGGAFYGRSAASAGMAESATAAMAPVRNPNHECRFNMARPFPLIGLPPALVTRLACVVYGLRLLCEVGQSCHISATFKQSLFV